MVELTKRITDINSSIQGQLGQVLNDDKTYDEFTKRYQLHLQLMDESFKILRDCYSEENTTQLNNINTFLEESAKLITRPDNEFYKFRNKWRRMNQLMVQASQSVEQAKRVLSKRCRITGTSFNSLYFFLQCENVESLDTLWEEYKSGKLLLEIAEQMDWSPSIAITIDERNYRAYRKFLGKSICTAFITLRLGWLLVCCLYKEVYLQNFKFVSF